MCDIEEYTHIDIKLLHLDICCNNGSYYHKDSPICYFPYQYSSNYIYMQDGNSDSSNWAMKLLLQMNYYI